MKEKLRCQSCGMPLQEGYYGKNEDGSDMKEYCFMCYKNGDFTEPGLTLEEMITRSVTYMTQNLNFSKEEAGKISRDTIPNLKRWQKQ